MLRYPAEPAALLLCACRSLVGDAAGCARQCGAPERRVRAAWHCRVLTGYSSVLTWAVDRTVRCAPPPGRGPTARSAAHVCGTTACTLGWVSGIARRGTWLVLLAGYSPGTPAPSTARTEARPSASTAAAVWSQQRTQAIRVCACAAPTRVPTGTAAPTNVGDTNPPTRAPTFAPTLAPTTLPTSAPTGKIDARIMAPPLPPAPPPPPPQS